MNARSVVSSRRLSRSLEAVHSACPNRGCALLLALVVGSFATVAETRHGVAAEADLAIPTCNVASPEAKALVEKYSGFYKELHASPELSKEEAQTAAKMAALLKRLGFETTEGVGGHGVVGLLKNGEGPTLMLRADMDALPVAEETGLPYASQVRATGEHGEAVGVMHACGHDMHMTMLAATLDALTSHRDQWQGTLMPVFQPAEERGAGAQAMIDDGLFQRFPRPDFALALHVAADRETGKIVYRTGYALANVDSVDVTVRGRGGHGAYPHTAVDPVVIAARLVLDLQTIVSREMNPVEHAVVTVGSIHGGTKHNVIGDECRLQITVRSFSPETREKLLAAIRRKAEAAAASSGAPAPEVAVGEGTPSMWNDPKLAERVLPAVRRLIGEANVVETEPSMGGEDFSRYGLAGVPIFMMSVGAVDADRMAKHRAAGDLPSLHSPKFYPDLEPTLGTGFRALTAASLELLQNKAAGSEVAKP
jgi:hippurate hydrolase